MASYWSKRRRVLKEVEQEVKHMKQSIVRALEYHDSPSCLVFASLAIVTLPPSRRADKPEVTESVPDKGLKIKIVQHSVENQVPHAALLKLLNKEQF